MRCIASSCPPKRIDIRSIQQPGFTLIELMVVVSIFAILLAIAIPAFATLVANMRGRTAASDFAADMAYARAQAYTTRGRVGISSANLANGWTVFRECQDIYVVNGSCNDWNDANGNGIPDPGETMETRENSSDFGVIDADDEKLKSHPALHSAITVCAKNSGGVTVAVDAITYGADGKLRVYNAGAEVGSVVGILFKPSDGSASGMRKVVLSPAGRVSVDSKVNPAETC